MANKSKAEAVSESSCLRTKFLDALSNSTSPSPCIRMLRLAAIAVCVKQIFHTFD